MISVVMAVYNGSKYIREQLESIMVQSKKVDEIVIIDDCSAKKCSDIITEVLSNRDCRVKYIEHTINRGYAQTFFEALRISEGDYIFFADQDDIWIKEKVMICVDIMMKYPEITCLSSLNVLIDGAGNVIRKENNVNRRLFKPSCEELISRKYLRPGMSIVITRELKKKIDLLDISQYEMHDRLIEYISAINGGFYILGEYLTNYRIHDSNTSGMNLSHFSLRSDKQARIDQIDKEVRYLDQISSYTNKNEEIINRCKEHFAIRRKLLEKGNIFKYVIYSLKCIKGYTKLSIWGGDIISIIKEKNDYKTCITI